MRTLSASLIARWVLGFVGAALLAALVWVFGPLLPALESAAVRAGIVLAIVALWAGANLFLDIRRRRRDAELAAGVAAAEPDTRAKAAAEEAAALEERLTTALALLKKARGSKGYLYEQPWYAIIGPPGAGKTTALLNAGLRFPLAAEMGQGAIAGVGGTRRCDWWFTEEAVLIDTAGRYTTQDSDAEIDRSGWLSFLDLLKRTRPRQPLNGLVVAIALSEIAGAPQAERLAHARAVRRRIKEIEERLAIRLPVYAVFTKADLIAGFTEFFDDLDRDRRAQVWGATFPLSEGALGSAGAFAGEFQALVERLDSRLFDRLQSERSPERRAQIAGFASQIASLEGPLGEFIAEAFGGSRLDPAPVLRGFYLSSGTQEGTPIDRLTGALARSFGIDQRRTPSLRPAQGRSYFLGRLVKEVIFGEAMLASQRPGAARRRLLLRAGAFTGIALVVLAGGALLWHARSANQQQITALAAALGRYENTAAALKLDPVADADLPRVLPLLDQARALPDGYDSGPVKASWSPLALSQHDKLAAGARAVYRHALERVLLPRLIWRLETQMRGNFDRPEFLYEATRVYLMLGDAGPLDRDLVRAWWVSLDWPSAYPGAVMAPVRTDLARHLDALLEQPLPAIALDGALIAEARTSFSRVPLASRIYSRIAPSAAARGLPPWRPADALGAAGAQIFLRASGQPLDAGIPGFYTPSGFHDVLLPALGNVTKEVADESWVLGTRSELMPDSPQALQVERDVIGLYEADYEKHWNALLADLAVAPLRTPQQAVQELYLLASPQSPMRDLVTAIAHQLTLSQPPAASGDAAAATAKGAASQVPAQLQALVASEKAGSAPAPPGAAVDAYYRAVRDYVGSGPSGAPIAQTLKALDALRQQLATLATAPAGSAPPPASGADPLLLVRAEAASAPQPVARWLQTIIAGAASLRTGSIDAQVKAAFDSSGGPAALCRQAVAGRYPFSAGAAADIPIGDFSRLFAPGGLLDGFFNTELRPYVDTTSRVWHLRPVDGVPPPVSPTALAEFKRAATIRDMFFAAGGNTPAVSFEMTPVALDGGAKSVTLDLGGTKISYAANGTPSATQITWPGANGMGTAQLTFDPPPAGGSGNLQANGPWALFHLFDQGSLVEDGAADRYRLTFQDGDDRAVFEISAGSVLNPFARGSLRGFRCPSL